MWEIDILLQIEMMLYSFFFAIILFIIYILVSAFVPDRFTNVFDIVFWIIAALIYFVFLLCFTNGTIGVYALAFMLIVYSFLFFAFGRANRPIKKLLLKIFNLYSRVLLYLGKFLEKSYIFIKKLSKKHLINNDKMLYNAIKNRKFRKQ